MKWLLIVLQIIMLGFSLLPYCSLRYYRSNNEQNSDYLTVALPKIHKQIDKNSEYVTQIQQRTTFNNDGDDDIPEKYSVVNGDYEDAFQNVDYTDNDHKDGNENNYNQPNIRGKDQNYMESGHIDEDIMQYENVIRKQSETTQQFKHIPKNTIMKYTKIDRPHSFNNKDDVLATTDYSNADLSELFDKYAQDTDQKSNAQFDLKNYDVDIDKLFEEKIKNSKKQNKYSNGEVPNQHWKRSHQNNVNGNRRMDSLYKRRQWQTLQKRLKPNYNVNYE
ncbi:unnamed protein product [Schistosoma turkestanicum]|nr:unnamed protein product [Schistosoma turkestanicum]